MANGTDGVQQVGNGTFLGNTAHAMLWSGSAASAVDLDPGGPTTPVGSVAYAVSGGMQVGWYNFLATAQTHACLWTGSAGSMVDLQAFLPANYSSSAAQAIWSDANATYIGGFANNTTTNHREAILWTRSNCTAAAVVLQPVPQTACAWATTSFAVTATGTGAITYRWQIESAPPGSNIWTNLSDGPINAGPSIASNTGTAILTISQAHALASARYRCRVDNACGGATSSAAALTVGFCGCSIADITGIGGPPATPDGLMTGDDFIAFISAFAAGDLLADITGIGGPPATPDGLVTGDDFNAFISGFVAGCP